MTEAEFLAAFHRQKDRVYRLALSYTKSVPDAEDVCQTVFLKLLQQPTRPPEAEKAWLIRVTANQCRDLLKSSWRRRTAPLEEAVYFSVPEDQELFQAVMALPPKDRVVIHLHYYEGYTAREIGSQLGISESAVQNRLMRARKRLKSLLKEEEHGQTLSKRL